MDVPLAHEVAAVVLSDSIFSILPLVSDILTLLGEQETHHSILKLGETKVASKRDIPDLELAEVLQ